MKNFEFYNPVKIIFGKGKISELSKNIPKKARILITYGGGSIKKNGILEQVQKALINHEYYEFGGIEPNPAYETLIKAVEIVKEKHIDFLLAVGGGSVIDGTKFIASASKYKGEDAYEICSKQAVVNEAIDLASILTIPATGSEMNANAVITRRLTKEKFAFNSPLVYPKFSILDPEVTYSLPKRQLANGVVDAFVHVLEQYLTYPTNSPLQDNFAEGILKTLVTEGNKSYLLNEPDYDNRANVMWAATMALNGLISCGVISDWATHQIGHELTALHNLDHAVTLAIVLPGLLQEVKEKRREKILRFGSKIWGIQEANESIALNKIIDRTERFFNELGIMTRLSDYNIQEETINVISERFLERNNDYIGFAGDISPKNVKNILKNRI